MKDVQVDVSNGPHIFFVPLPEDFHKCYLELILVAIRSCSFSCSGKRGK